MNRNEFNRFIAGIDLPGPGDLEGLKELTDLFPWFHSAHLLLLRGLKENSDIRFDSQLKSSALSVSDREVLYHYLYTTPAGVLAGAVIPAPVAVTDEAVAEVAADVMKGEQKHSAPVTMEDIAAEPVVADESSVGQEHTEQVEVAEVMAEEHENVAPVIDTDTATEPETAAPASIIEEDTEHGASAAESLAAEITEPGAPVAEALAEEITEPDATAAEALSEEFAESDATAAEAPVEVVEETEPAGTGAPVDANADLRTREELINEIEARLRELRSEYNEIPEVETPPQQPQAEATAPQPPEVFREDETPAQQKQEEIPEEETLAPQPPEDIIVVETPAQQVPEEITAYMEQESPGLELLELLPDSETDEVEANTKLTATDLIDRFIMISPTIERMSPKDYQPVRDLSEESPDEPGKFITETLAKIYITQGYYTKAINIYEKLTLQFPEKSAYFASRIEKIKDLIK